MRVLMFGWEFPPYMSGGLGTACYGMTRALAEKGVNINFVLPRMEGQEQLSMPQGLSLHEASGTRIEWNTEERKEHWQESTTTYTSTSTTEKKYAVTSSQTVTSPPSQRSGKSVVQELWHNNLCIHPVKSLLHAYATPQSYAEAHSYCQVQKTLLGHSTSYLYDPCHAPAAFMQQATHMVTEQTRQQLLHVVKNTQQQIQHSVQKKEEVLSLHGGYGQGLMEEVFRYSQSVLGLDVEEFDVIHAHDWMTCPAGIVAKNLTGKPLIVHIHALESDRSGANLNTEVAAIERAGLEAADTIITVSHYTKNRITQLYGIDPQKISVVHNAVTQEESRAKFNIPHHDSREKYVLFMGRITFQKGPEYFVQAAKLVLSRMPHVRFIMAGSGDMLPRIVNMVAQMRMGSRFHFTGFLRGEEVDKMYAMSDLYVMPSVSEPFGIAPLEAMSYDTPVLISRQSGVAEVVQNALKVDFWDIRAMADKICAVLTHPRLASEMTKQCREELQHIRWENAATKLMDIYENCHKTQ